jgi:uncharacterized phage protein gp47/JayE
LEEAVDSVFRTLGPGDTLLRSRLIAALMNVPGVTDVTLVQPADNVTCLADETALQLIVRGSLTLS